VRAAVDLLVLGMRDERRVWPGLMPHEAGHLGADQRTTQAPSGRRCVRASQRLYRHKLLRVFTAPGPASTRHLRQFTALTCGNPSRIGRPAVLRTAPLPSATTFLYQL
jgi:hypothetical protein